MAIDQEDFLQIQQINGAELVPVQAHYLVALQVQDLRARVQLLRNLREVRVVAAHALLAVHPFALAGRGTVGGEDDGGGGGGGDPRDCHGQKEKKDDDDDDSQMNWSGGSRWHADWHFSANDSFHFKLRRCRHCLSVLSGAGGRWREF